jgi:hypothetical protein
MLGNNIASPEYEKEKHHNKPPPYSWYGMQLLFAKSFLFATTK